MDAEEVERALADAELVTCAQAPLVEAKQLRDACLDADIPVLLDRGACCGSGGCGCAPKLELRARPEDLSQWYVRTRDGEMTPFSAFSKKRMALNLWSRMNSKTLPRNWFVPDLVTAFTVAPVDIP